MYSSDACAAVVYPRADLLANLTGDLDAIGPALRCVIGVLAFMSCMLVACRVRHSVAIYGQQRMCMRSKAWLAACVSLRLARLLPLQAVLSAYVAYAPRLRLRQAFSRMLWSQNSKS